MGTVRAVLERGRVVSVQPFTSAAHGMNGPLELAILREGGHMVEAVRKGPRAQLAQELFAQFVARIVGIDDLIAPAVVRSDGLYVARISGASAQDAGIAGRSALGEAFARRYAGAEDALELGLRDHDRLLAFDYLIANGDRRPANIIVNDAGAWGIDNGMAGGSLVRTPEGMLAPPLAQAESGMRKLDFPRTYGTVEEPHRRMLGPDALRGFTAAHETEIRRAHAAALAVQGPSAPNMRATDAFFRSQEYIDGVIARLRHLESTHEVRAITIDNAIRHPKSVGQLSIPQAIAGAVRGLFDRGASIAAAGPPKQVA